jgi:DNA-binding HxlR family transcriptional regulator
VSPSRSRRSYAQHCGLARALDLVGERWTLLVVRDLLLGPRRYGDLLASLEGITTNLLAKRLREMREAGLIEKRKLPPPGSSEVYALTDSGLALEPAVMELARWGGHLLNHPRRGDRMDIGWALLSMKRLYRGSPVFVAEIECGGRRFELAFGGERLGVAERPAERASLKIRAADQEALFDVFFRGVRSAALERRGALEVTGDRAQWSALLGAFTPPVASSGGAGRKAVLGGK